MEWLRRATAAMVQLLVISSGLSSALLQNGTAPQFAQQEYNFSVVENLSPGWKIGRVAATYPPDSKQNGQILYEIDRASSSFSLLTINDKGELWTKVTFDREETIAYEFNVTARNSENPVLRSSVPVRIEVDDMNDNAPIFLLSWIRLSVAENAAIGTRVGVVIASDLDSGVNARLTYSLSLAPTGHNPVPFGVSPTTGEITPVSMSIDREANSSFQFLVIVVDGGESRQFTSTCTVIVNVEDVNDNAPQFNQSEYAFSVTENAPLGTVVGIVSASDRDAGRNAEVTFEQLNSDLVPFTLAAFRDSMEIRVAQPIDREMKHEYSFYLRASDAGQPSLTGSALVTVSIEDVNDNTPVWIWPSRQNYQMNASRSDLRTGSVVTRVRAVDADAGDFGDIRYSILSGNGHGVFHIDEAEGSLAIRRQLPPDVSEFQLQLRASDCAKVREAISRTAYVTLIVNVIDSDTGNGGALKTADCLLSILAACVLHVMAYY